MVLRATGFQLTNFGLRANQISFLAVLNQRNHTAREALGAGHFLIHGVAELQQYQHLKVQVHCAKN